MQVLWLTGNHYSPNEREYKKMKVAGNRLHQLHPQQFEGLKSLQVLLLHHNRLETLPDSLFDGLAKLRVLKLLDNPFRPRLTRSHPAFIKALQGGVLQQLDLDEDSGDSLEDEWEETSRLGV
ncbi:sli, partial [Symbiodinium sp. KB8]